MNHDWLKSAKKWVIPSHLEQSRLAKSETILYWMVTITLTSGEVKEFYIKARFYTEALEKANSISYLANVRFKNKSGFRLIP